MTTPGYPSLPSKITHKVWYCSNKKYPKLSTSQSVLTMNDAPFFFIFHMRRYVMYTTFRITKEKRESLQNQQ